MNKAQKKVHTPLGPEPFDQAIKWHLPTMLRWIAENAIVEGRCPDGSMVSQVLEAAADNLDRYGP